MKQMNDHLYQVSQALIEIWESLGDVMTEQDVSIDLLSYKTGLTERELEDYLHNYADVKVGTLFKIARALDRTVSIKVEDAKQG
jgi:hypothetical protein